MKKKNFRSFSLIELSIVLMILSVCFSFIGISVKNAIDKYQYETSVQRMKDKFYFCRNMANVHQSDIFLNLKKSKKGLILSISTDEENGLFRGVKEQDEILKNIDFHIDNNNVNSQILMFSSTGNVFPQIKLQLFSKKGQKNDIFDLSSFSKMKTNVNLSRKEAILDKEKK
jgi:prepilin-type N-terminal cleavage/methylation domain-containing protein